MKIILQSFFSIALIVIIAQLPNELNGSSSFSAVSTSSTNSKFKIQNACSSSCLMDYKKIAKCDSKSIIKDYLIEQIIENKY